MPEVPARHATRGHQAMAKRSRAGRLRIHVENDPHHSEVYHITPALFGRRVRRSPGLAGRIAITYGQDPALLDAALAESEVLVVGNIDGTGLADRAPRLRWIQTTTAGVEKLAPTLPDSVVLTNASGVHGPKGGEYAMTALLMLNHRVPHFATAQRAGRWEQVFMTPIAGKTVLILGVAAMDSAQPDHQPALRGRRFDQLRRARARHLRRQSGALPGRPPAGQPRRQDAGLLRLMARPPPAARAPAPGRRAVNRARRP